MANNTGTKYGGRQKGTPNKTTKETRDVLKSIIDSEIQNLPELFQEMKPHQRADILIKLIQYVLPKPESSEAFNDNLNEILVLPEWLSSPIN
jgi:hypothetical protein